MMRELALPFILLTAGYLLLAINNSYETGALAVFLIAVASAELLLYLVIPLVALMLRIEGRGVKMLRRWETSRETLLLLLAQSTLAFASTLATILNITTDSLAAVILFAVNTYAALRLVAESYVNMSRDPAVGRTAITLGLCTYLIYVIALADKLGVL